MHSSRKYRLFLGEMWSRSCTSNCVGACMLEKDRKGATHVYVSKCPALCVSAIVMLMKYTQLFRMWCHELFHLYILVSSTWTNSAALFYVDKPAAKRTPETPTHQLNSSILPLTVFNNSCYYFKWCKDQKFIRHQEVLW